MSEASASTTQSLGDILEEEQKDCKHQRIWEMLSSDGQDMAPALKNPLHLGQPAQGQANKISKCSRQR